MTLADLLVSVAVLGLVLAATFVTLEQGQRTYRRGVARVEAQQSARIALDRMAREIRQAGTGMAPMALSVAERTRIVLHFDLDGDGVATARREVVTWRLDGRILRRDAGGGAQPIVEGVRDLELTYFDRAGRATSVPDDVRAVAIALTAESRLPEAGATAMRTMVSLRNR